MEQKHQILIIDDEEEFSGLIKYHLERIGSFEVYTASDGKSGIALAKRIKPDLILLDILMPGIDGFEVLKKLKSDTQTVKIPVIMFSAVSDVRAKVKASQLFDEEYITKPVDIQVLKEKMEKVLSRRYGEHEHNS